MCCAMVGIVMRVTYETELARQGNQSEQEDGNE
jgi:cell division protein FtsW